VGKVLGAPKTTGCLGKTGYPRFYPRPGGIPRQDFPVALVLRQHIRPGADQRHIPPPYIEELGEFIEMGTPEPPAQRRDPFVPDKGDTAICVLIYIHGPQLYTKEPGISFLPSFLYKENGTSRIQSHQQGQ